MIWDIREAEWDRMFNIAYDYYQENGDLMIPRVCEYKGEKLGKWINTQRNVYSGKRRSQQMSELRIQKLESIGMVWNTLNYEWERMYNIAVNYFKEFGNLQIPKGKMYQNEKLGDWLYIPKRVFKGNQNNQVMTEERKNKLELIGINWWT